MLMSCHERRMLRATGRKGDFIFYSRSRRSSSRLSLPWALRGQWGTGMKRFGRWCGARAGTALAGSGGGGMAGDDDLAPFGIGESEDGDVGELPAGAQRGLHLGRVHFLAAGDD